MLLHLPIWFNAILKVCSHLLSNKMMVFLSMLLFTIILRYIWHYFQSFKNVLSSADFTNIFCVAFTHPDPKSANNTVKQTVFFVLLGSAHLKASSKHIDEINPMLVLIHSAFTSLDLVWWGSKLLKMSKYFYRGDLNKSLRC